jgi:hypothetical protein
MIRWLTILTLLLAGLPRQGVGLAGHGPACADSSCHEAVVRTSCCSAEREAESEGFCPASGGQCQCGVAPGRDPRPRPEAPLPKAERDWAPAVLPGRPIIAAVRDADAEPPVAPGMAGAIHRGLSHNALRALTGVWLT